MARKVLTEAQIVESIKFADGGMAAAGHKVDRHHTREDAEQVLRGRLSAEESIARAVGRIKK